MTIFPLRKSAVMPWAPVNISVDEYEQVAGHKACKDEEVLLTFPVNPDVIDIGFYKPYAVVGTVKEENLHGLVCIETAERVLIDYDDADDIPGGIQFSYSSCFEEDDISEAELNASKARISKALSTVKGINTKWVKAILPLLNSAERPEIILSLPPLNFIDVDKCYEILAEDSLKNRTAMAEAYIIGVINSGELKKAFDDIDAGRNASSLSDYELLEQKVDNSGMSPEALTEVNRSLNRLKKEPPNSQEYALHYEYVKRCAELPWKKEKFRKPNLEKAKKILDEKHFGMNKVKERIIQALSVMALNKKHSGTILCLVGAPGVGKTSICRSIAEALGRKYARVSLGGVHDEAEIRGHRKTYIGAMCGRIIDAISKCGTTNPVIVLDEIDKLGVSLHGDPSAALLEVLDPEQNSTFTDHYLNFPYDLSDVMFICTANTLDTISEPLLNRMEVLRFENYTPSEKFSIAVNHLLPQAVKQSGLPKDFLTIPDDTIKEIISGYTMEGGVRNLKRCFDTICAKSAEKLLLHEADKIVLEPSQLREFLDMKPVHSTKAMEKAEPGVVTGLAWTQLGGKILYIETLFTKGSGKTIITGQLGDVMKESAQIAVSLVKSMYPDKTELFDQNDLHIHVPEGAVPKDGPSAGIALTTALASLVTGKAVDGKIAMTGEVSLHGNVTAIGGLREKLSGAKAAGITTIFIPDENKDDLAEFPAEITSGLNIIPVSNAAKVLELAGIKRA